MKKPVVNLRQFRLRRLNEPEYSHLKLLFGWVVYFSAYFLTENLISVESCRPMHCFIDDMIPFCEYFVVFYVFWYLMVAGSLLYFAMYDPDSFRALMKYIIITQVVAMIIYVVYPSRQDLRPTEFLNNNIFTRIVAFIYQFDTSTNVCPSLHVAYSVGLISVWTKQKDVSPRFRAFMVINPILVCLSTMFVKQHSAVDVFAALPVCLLAEAIVYRRRYFHRHHSE